MNILKKSYVGYLLDSNIIIGIIRDEEEVLNIVKTLDKSKSLFVCSTTIEEVQNYSDLYNINPHLYNRISIIETIHAITLSNNKKNQKWLWDEIFFDTNKRLKTVIDVVLKVYNKSLHENKIVKVVES